MYNIVMTAQFKKDLDNLDKSIRERVPKTISQLEQDPHQQGLGTHPQKGISNRMIYRSRINDQYRILWEWLDGSIGLWRLGKHDFIDSFDNLPMTDNTKWDIHEDETQPATNDWRPVLKEPQPFKHVPSNHLRLFGVPDEQLETIHNLTDPEALWDLGLPENVKLTLIDILSKGEEWEATSFLNTKQLLYRTSVDQLEGYCEGKIKRLLLNLTEEQEDLVKFNMNGTILIKGVAGSGKTTVGLYRAYHLAQQLANTRRMFGEQTSILVLTYTKTLAKALEELLIEIHGHLYEGIIVKTFSAWMMDLLRPNNRIIESSERSQFIKQARQIVFNQNLSAQFINQWNEKFLLDEINKVIRARSITTLTDYQKIDRIGRGVALDREKQRPILWQIYQQYQKLLDENGVHDWEDLPRLVLQRCHPLPKYDVIVIDEAQDFPPSHLQLIAQVAQTNEEKCGLNLLADPAQSIYYRGISWREGGIEVRGRTRTLAKNFRNTQQILEAAKCILDKCEDLKTENEYIPPTSTYRLGQKPILMQYSSQEEQWTFIAKSIVQLAQSGQYRLSDIVILAKHKRSLDDIIPKLSRENIPNMIFRDDIKLFENKVKLITMHSAKGLEFPVVFLIDMSNDIIPRIESQETEKFDLEQERKLFYVSMTRASERLYIFYPKHYQSSFIRDINPQTVSMRSISNTSRLPDIELPF